jgi:agmatine deiminase
LRSATDVDNQPLKIVVVDGPSQIRPGNNPDTFAAGYINYYASSRAIFLPEFGDAKADSIAKKYMRSCTQDAQWSRSISTLSLPAAGIHCTTQQEII